MSDECNICNRNVLLAVLGVILVICLSSGLQFGKYRSKVKN